MNSQKWELFSGSPGAFLNEIAFSVVENKTLCRGDPPKSGSLSRLLCSSTQSLRGILLKQSMRSEWSSEIILAFDWLDRITRR